ncbi:hypothetical protein HDV57DRAFT_453598 [Trichoderma longibrachiatum]
MVRIRVVACRHRPFGSGSSSLSMLAHCSGIFPDAFSGRSWHIGGTVPVIVSKRNKEWLQSLSAFMSSLTKCSHTTSSVPCNPSALNSLPQAVASNAYNSQHSRHRDTHVMSHQHHTTQHTKTTSQYRTVIQTRANSETASQLVGSAVGVTLRWFECRNGNSAAAKASPTLSSPFSLLQLFLHNQKPSRLLLLFWPRSFQRVNVNLHQGRGKNLSS